MYHENILPKLSWIIVLLILFTLLPACQSSQASSPTGTAATDSVPTTTSNTETTTPEETTLPFETTIPAITTDDGVFDKTDLLALLAEADAMLNEQNTFTLPLTTYINYAAGTVRSALEGYYSISDTMRMRSPFGKCSPISYLWTCSAPVTRTTSAPTITTTIP